MQFYRIQYYLKNAHQTNSYVDDGSCSFPLGGGSSGPQQHGAAASEAAAGEELAPSVSLLSRDKKQVQWSRKVCGIDGEKECDWFPKGQAEG